MKTYSLTDSRSSKYTWIKITQLLKKIAWKNVESGIEHNVSDYGTHTLGMRELYSRFDEYLVIWADGKFDRWKSETQFTSYELRVKTHELRVQIHELRVQIRELEVLIVRIKVRVGRLKARVVRLKARLRRSKARVDVIKPRVRL